MILIRSSCINKHDSLAQALAKKADNRSISSVTKQKLVSTANTHAQLPRAAGAYIYQSKDSIDAQHTPFSRAVIIDVRQTLQNALSAVSNEDVRTTFGTWINNCNSLLKTPAATQQFLARTRPAGIDTLRPAPPTTDHVPFIGEGSRGKVKQAGERAIKTFHTFHPHAIRHELTQCNHYLSATGNTANQAFLDGDTLNMPYIEGETPSLQETKTAVQELFERGFMMGDPAPENFKKTPDGKVVPVDFGLMFQHQSALSVHKQVMIEIVHDYAKGGFKCIPAVLHSHYRDSICAMDTQLGAQGQLGRMNIPQLKQARLF